MEWDEYKQSLCSGCRRPRLESFDPANSDAYSTTALECHACAARDRRAWSDNETRDAGQPPPHGRYYAVTFDDDEG